MAQYVARAAPITAHEVSNETAPMIANWIGGRVVHETTLDDEDFLGVNVPTLEGVVRASRGEFVVMDHEGQVKVYGPNRFRELYKEIA